MKKLVLLSVALCLLFVGCEKEGVYNPSKKIRRIYEQPQSSMKQLSQEWTWDKNLLTKVDYYNNQLNFTENYKYDDKKRIIKVEDYKYGDYYIVMYYNGVYSKIEYFWDNILVESYSFTYENKKVSKIACTFFDDYISDKSNGFISQIIPKNIIEKVKENMQKYGAGTSTVTLNIKYDGNNVSEIKTMKDGFVERTSFESYDSKTNPFYSSFPLAGASVFSKNNPGKTISVIYEDESNMFATDLDYTYDGNFPIVIVEKYTIGTVNFRNTTFIEYK